MKHLLGKRSADQDQSHELHDLMLEREHLLSNSEDFFVGEAYRTLRTNVSFSLTGESSSNVVVVTSSLQHEGKSYTAANLAISYAQAGKRVLLIDCDLRKPKISRLLRLHAEAGLSNVLIHPELCKSALLETKEKNLRVLISGDIPPNPSELLGSVRMQKLLEALRSRFEFIILDTPPVNVVTDAAVLAPLSDGILFVIRAGQSERNAVTSAVDQLRYANAKILGFVLNGVDPENRNHKKYKKYGRYGEYSSSYGYDSEKAAETLEDWDLSAGDMDFGNQQGL